MADANNDTLAIYEGRVGPAAPSAYREKVQQLLRASVAPNTRRAYASRLKHFFGWCEAEGIVPPFPASPETVAAYVASLAEAETACATVDQTMAALAAAHRAGGLTSPTESLLVRKTIKGYRREHGTAQKKKDAATLEVVKMLLAARARGSSPKDVRDAAIIALGFAGAFRRSELSALDAEDLRWTLRDGEEILLITVRRSKTDQEGQGLVKAIFPGREADSSPTSLLKRWIELAGIQEGALFREILKGGRITGERMSPQSMRLVVKRAAAAAGLSLDLSAHSLRSGFVTTAIRQGKTERSIMNQTGHRSAQTLREYFQREDAIEDNAARDLM